MGWCEAVRSPTRYCLPYRTRRKKFNRNHKRKVPLVWQSEAFLVASNEMNQKARGDKKGENNMIDSKWRYRFSAQVPMRACGESSRTETRAKWCMQRIDGSPKQYTLALCKKCANNKWGGRLDFTFTLSLGAYATPNVWLYRTRVEWEMNADGVGYWVNRLPLNGTVRP